jgi:hypothetical protein
VVGPAAPAIDRRHRVRFTTASASIISGMRSSSLRLVLHAIATLAMLGLASAAWGQVYKCTDAEGKTTYSGAPCDAAAKPLKLPEDPKANTTSPAMCAQLLDETRRLDAEADKDAKVGRPETAEHAKKRQTMTKRYSERCVGVSRAGAVPR